MCRLYLLGTGTPTPTARRFGTCYVLAVEDDLLMFDCGPSATYKLVKAGLFPTQVDCLFFTHHHFDHNADFPCFLLCRWDQSTGREDRLSVWGPPPTRWMYERLVGQKGAFSHDWKARVGAPVSQSVHVNRGGSLPRPEPDADVADIRPGAEVSEHGWTVKTARASHVEPHLEALAYRVDSPAGSVAFAGDTGLCEPVVGLASGAEVLVVNCWDHQQTMEANGESAGQTGTLDAGQMASECGAERLVLAHTGPALCRPGSREKAVADIAAAYDGEIVFAEEMMVLPLG